MWYKHSSKFLLNWFTICFSYIKAGADIYKYISLIRFNNDLITIIDKSFLLINCFLIRDKPFNNWNILDSSWLDIYWVCFVVYQPTFRIRWAHCAITLIIHRYPFLRQMYLYYLQCFFLICFINWCLLNPPLNYLNLNLVYARY